METIYDRAVIKRNLVDVNMNDLLVNAVYIDEDNKIFGFIIKMGENYDRLTEEQYNYCIKNNIDITGVIEMQEVQSFRYTAFSFK